MLHPTRILLALLTGASLAAQSTPVISEIMADNVVTLADEDGETSDYIELHNPTGQSVDLGGWYLSDDPANRRKWALPKPTPILAGGFLLVFASDKDRAISGKPLHANFKLSAGGEYIGLSDPAGRLVHDLGPSFPRQYPDMSYGGEFNPGWTSKRVYFVRGTPFQPNGLGAAVVGDVSHAPKILVESADCVVTAEIINPNRDPIQSVLLHYRVDYAAESSVAMRDDGQSPDLVANDYRYTAAIPASRYGKGQMLRWRLTTSIQGGATAKVPVYQSSIDSPEYFGTAVDDPGANSGIPTFHWWVKDAWRANTTAGTRCSVAFGGEFYDNVFVRVRGNTSKSYPKLSYKFDFNASYGFRFDPKHPRVDETNLNTTYADKAFLRQILAYETYRDVGAEHSVTMPVRQQRNGQFFMVSILTEQVDRKYLDRQGLDSRGALYKVYNSLEYFSTSNLEQKVSTPAGYDDIKLLISSLAGGTAARERYLWDRVDLPACINYWAATVLMHDNDCVHKNYYVYRDHYGDGEWRFLPWDKDLVFGRNYFGTVLNDTIWAERDPQSHPLYGDASHPKIDGPYNRLIHAMLATPRIREMYLRRLRGIMDQLLSAKGPATGRPYFEDRIDALQQAMGAAVGLDQAQWGVPGYGDRTLDFAKAVGVLKTDYLPRRRRHLFTTHHAGGSGIIPGPQKTFGFRFGFGSIDVNPVSGNRAEQYVEVVNSDSTAVDLSGWWLRGSGIEFRFIPGTVVGSNHSVFVAASPTAFRSRAVGPSGGQSRFVVGPFEGGLEASDGLVLYDERGQPVTATGEFPLSVTTTGQGDVDIQVTRAAPNQPLWILFSTDSSGSPGSGPVLGLGSDVVGQLGLPLGTDPIHVGTDGLGGYAWSAPPQTIPKGVQLTIRAAYQDSHGRLVVSQVERVTF